MEITHYRVQEIMVCIKVCVIFIYKDEDEKSWSVFHDEFSYFFVYEKGLLKRRGLERVEKGNTGGSINKFCAADCIFVCAVL